MRYIVLGGYGIIGREVVRDLFDFTKDEIIIAGRDKEAVDNYVKKFNSRVKGVVIDINSEKLVDLLKKGDVCVNCLQYKLNVKVMNACLKAKINYVDLGGLFHETRKQIKLGAEFKKIGRTAVLGCGSTPGVTNVMIGYASNFMNKIKSIEITFADIDRTKYEQAFVLPYSFKTIVDELTQNPAVFRNKKIEFVEPRSGKKIYHLGKYGGVEAFYSLHSELATIPYFLKGKGLENCEFRVTFDRDFVNIFDTLISLGLTKGKINVKGQEIEVIDGTTQIMDRFIAHQPINDEEMLYVKLDNNIIKAVIKSKNGISAGIRDTAIPCSIIAQMVSSLKPGVYAPESVIDANVFFKELNKREIEVYFNNKIIG